MVKAALVVPYAVWMALMAVLPNTAGAYAVRTAATAVALLAGLIVLNRLFRNSTNSSNVSNIFLPFLFGLGVCAVWVAPEALLGQGAPVLAAESPFSPQNCGWPLTVVRLVGSAFVIAVAEELFFRKWLMEWAGFGWMVALFAVEHGDRWLVGALAGIAYGLVMRRFGLRAAVVAHMTTNLALGLWVVFGEQWGYW